MYDDANDPDDSAPPDRTVSTDSTPATVRYDWKRSGRPSVAVFEAVAAATDRPTTDLPPLQGVLDTDAFDTLLDGRRSSVTVSFRYAGTTVSVNGNGAMEIRVDEDRIGENDG